MSDPARPNFLLELIVSILAPLFFGVANGNVALARAGAAETIKDYQARNNADLIAVGQIITNGLASMAAAVASMEDGLAAPAAMGLRKAALAMARSAEANRRAIRTNHTDPLPNRRGIAAVPPPPRPDTQAATDALRQAKAVQIVQASAEARLRDESRLPSANGAANLTTEAKQVIANLSTLHAAERETANIRTTALNGTANHLLTGTKGAPFVNGFSMPATPGRR